MADPTVRVRAFSSFHTDATRNDFVINNAEALVPQSLVAVDTADGKLKFADNTTTHLPVGVVVGSVDGLDENLTGDAGGTKKAVTQGSITLKNVSVTGVSAITDIGSLVYATDGQTMTLTAGTSVPIGVVTKWYATTYCDVYLFNLIESAIIKYTKNP